MHRWFRRVMRDVAEDPAEFDDLGPQLLGHRRLLRGRIEQLTALAAVVVHLDAEGLSPPCRPRPRRWPSSCRAAIARTALGHAPSRPTGSGWVESRKATVSWVSSRCEGPRSVEAPSNSANGPPIIGGPVVRPAGSADPTPVQAPPPPRPTPAVGARRLFANRAPRCTSCRREGPSAPAVR